MSVILVDAAIALLAASLLVLTATGGFDVEVGPVRARLHDWIRPLAVLGLLVTVRVWLLKRRTTDGVSLLRHAVHLGFVVVLTAVGGTYAMHHIRVAGGLDSYGYVSAARLIASGRLSEPQPIAALLPFEGAMEAATPLGHVPHGEGDRSVPRFPVGLPLVMAMFTVFGPSGPFFVPLVMAYVAMVLAYLLGAKSATGQGLFAAALVAADPLFAAYAMQPMSDVPATCWLLGALWIVERRRSSPHVAWSIAAGSCAGMAMLTRPALVPAVVVLVLASWTLSTRRFFTGLAAIVAAFIAAQLALNAVLYGDLSTSGYGTTSHMFELSVARLNANVSNFGKWLTYSHTPLFWLLWPGAMVVLRHDKWAWRMSAIAAAAAAPYLFYVVFDDWESSRFLLPSIAIVLVLAARAVSHPRPIAQLGMLLVAFLCAAASHRFLDREGIYRLGTLEAKYALAGEWFKTHTPRHALVVAGLHSGTIRMYGDRPTIRWDRIPENELASTVDALREAGYQPYVALDLPSEPAAFAERFRFHPPLEQIARVRVVNIYKFVSAP